MVDAIRKRFLVGVLLAWVPWISIVIGLHQAFRGISKTKATGIAAIAGGLGGAFALWGIIGMVVAQIAAIVWLGKSFAPEHSLRNLVSVLSIVVSGLMLVLVCLFLAAIWVSSHH
jgi:hypothetical protein